MRSWAGAWSQSAQAFWSDAEPRDHFSTSAGEVVADRLLIELQRIDGRLDHPDQLTILDIGAGDGSLLRLIANRAPASLRGRLRLVGVDVRARSAQTAQTGPEWITTWAPSRLDVEPVRGIVMAHEWLDEIPCDVIERDGAGRDRLVLVDDFGGEHLGPPLDDAQACAAHGFDAGVAREWLAQWWPLAEPGDRAEVGLSRDAAWTWLTSLLGRGLVVATDYGHTRHERITRFRGGTLTGYAYGRQVRPVPSGSTNVTAHVAVDSCASAVPGTTLTSQRDMLAAVSATLPDPGDALAFAQGLERRSSLAMLRDAQGLGAFTWMRWERT